MTKSIEVRVVPGVPLVAKGDDVGQIICEATARAGIDLVGGDVLAVASKIVAKAEGRVRPLDSFDPRHFSLAIARKTGRDPRLVKAILDESSDLIQAEPGTPENPGVIVVRHNSGVVVAGAGIDRKNTGVGGDVVVLLPEDSDSSARAIAKKIKEGMCGVDVGVVIVDSLGDPYRTSAHGKAIGVANIPSRQVSEVRDLEGRVRVEDIALADGLAAFAMILMGEGDDCSPVVMFRGVEYAIDSGATIKDVLK